jgi:hypothetical protein
MSRRFFLYNGQKYRSYKHPILEYIFNKAREEFPELPDEIPFTYQDIYEAMDALKLERPQQASYSNFTIDLLRRANTHEERVPAVIWNSGYDLDRMPKRNARQGYAGRLVRAELKAKEPWIVWPDIRDDEAIVVTNLVPDSVKPYLGNDEGALLSVMDYCDILSHALNGTPGSIKRVQHPKKWQPGEVDGLYILDSEDLPVLYPVEAKALSTGDSVNRAQVEGMYKTITAKVTGIRIVPLAVQMIPYGMFIAVFEESPTGTLTITLSLKVKIDPPIESWVRGKQTRRGAPKKNRGFGNRQSLV